MNSKTSSSTWSEAASTGIPGLDKILSGGFPRGHVYLVEGDPGTGKTTLALQYLLEGVRRGEQTLYVTLSETWQDLEAAAISHGWKLNRIEYMEILLSSEPEPGEAESFMFHSSEIELGETFRKIREAVKRLNPSRVVIDSLTEIRLQAETNIRFRREILSLRQFLRKYHCTGLLLDETCEERTTKSVVHGIVQMKRHTLEFGPARRLIEVTKLRGRKIWDGRHDYTIEKGGLKVFPRIVSKENRQSGMGAIISSGLPGLDALMGGGLPGGSTTLIIGPAGAGKSSVATQFACQVLKKGKNAAIFTFDETPASYLARAAGINLDLQPFISEGRLEFRQVDPGEISPGEFTQIIQEAVEVNNARLLVVDSLNGYINAMSGQGSVIVQLHEIATYLNQLGVLTFFIVSQTGLIGSTENPLDISYVSDNVMLMRPFEAAGMVLHAISMVKKRTGQHERTIRELEITSEGLVVGKTLRDFQGILSGVPQFSGQKSELLSNS
jgi:circadian clock protein KaiC